MQVNRAPRKPGRPPEEVIEFGRTFDRKTRFREDLPASGEYPRGVITTILNGVIIRHRVPAQRGPPMTGLQRMILTPGRPDSYSRSANYLIPLFRG